MTVSSYLRTLSDMAVLDSSEEQSIQTSISTVKSRLVNYFDDASWEQFVFGSYARSTILPRKMDEKSDIDYMVVFRDHDNIPQTYLNWLRNFVDHSYPRTEIKQSFPTIKLNLNHITFELVPALKKYQGVYMIPSKSHSYDSWILTDPDNLNRDLIATEIQNYNIRSLVKIVKYWNTQNGYIFESYDLEQKIVKYPFYSTGLIKFFDLTSCFYQFMDSLLQTNIDVQWKADKLSKAQTILDNAKQYDQRNSHDHAESEIKKLFPEPPVWPPPPLVNFVG